MSKDIFENIIKTIYNFESIEQYDDEEKLCALCGDPIGDFDDNGIYGGEYCEECFLEAEEDRLR